jgi:hypothetical protein
MFSRPLYHAEEEFHGPGSPSSRFHEKRIATSNHAYYLVTIWKKSKYIVIHLNGL